MNFSHHQGVSDTKKTACYFASDCYFCLHILYYTLICSIHMLEPTLGQKSYFKISRYGLDMGKIKFSEKILCKISYYSFQPSQSREESLSQKLSSSSVQSRLFYR
ncbi:hypothetical protein Y032_0479g2206 [Ancylostoma ceylanicum]|uniref:Uncharacterized protein n=1 Tax=Ancylostoma ceylanicum TaxID=53326 RepID=A0A016WVH6_9BILA|nr:hypothetical protein Y032_0479g2206 [Ancylostoma ceylanicum]